MTQDSGRNADGTFKKGNKIGVKPIEKDLAQHLTWQALFRCAQRLFELSNEDLAIFMREHQNELPLGELVFLESFKNRNTKLVIWMSEQIIGKPKQVVDSNHSVNNSIEDFIKQTIGGKDASPSRSKN